MRMTAWLLTAASLALAGVGFSRGGTIAAATLGLPGSSAAFFFLTLARVAGMESSRVKTLGSWPFFAAGASLSLGALAGASTLVVPRFGVVALPLVILGSPLLAVACLRLSTAFEQRTSWYGMAVAALALAAAAVITLVGLGPLYGIG